MMHDPVDQMMKDLQGFLPSFLEGYLPQIRQIVQETFTRGSWDILQGIREVSRQEKSSDWWMIENFMSIKRNELMVVGMLNLDEFNRRRTWDEMEPVQVRVFGRFIKGRKVQVYEDGKVFVNFEDRLEKPADVEVWPANFGLLGGLFDPSDVQVGVE